VWGEEAQWQEVRLLEHGEGDKELGVAAVIEVLDEGHQGWAGLGGLGLLLGLSLSDRLVKLN